MRNQARSASRELRWSTEAGELSTRCSARSPQRAEEGRGAQHRDAQAPAADDVLEPDARGDLQPTPRRAEVIERCRDQQLRFRRARTSRRSSRGRPRESWDDGTFLWWYTAFPEYSIRAVQSRRTCAHMVRETRRVSERGHIFSVLAVYRTQIFFVFWQELSIRGSLMRAIRVRSQQNMTE